MRVFIAVDIRGITPILVILSKTSQDKLGLVSRMTWKCSGESNAPEDNTMAKEKILVVDDEEDILELLNFNLSREGYQVSCASSGEEALSEVRSDLPHPFSKR